MGRHFDALTKIPFSLTQEIERRRAHLNNNAWSISSNVRFTAATE